MSSNSARRVLAVSVELPSSVGVVCEDSHVSTFAAT